MREPSRATRALRWAMLVLALGLPTISLVPFGSIWLWQNGYLLIWGITVTVLVSIAWSVQAWLLRDTLKQAKDEEPIPLAPPEPGWTPAEDAAWRAVQTIAASADPEKLASRDAVIALGLRTVEAVARKLHPEKKEPLLQFTAPEALALIERVATRMNAFIRESVPLSDRLTVAQMATLYSWRGSVDTLEKAYDVWRAIRVLNPAAALASEVRERLSKEMMTWGKSYVARRIATAFVEEVGRAAIDLYGGRLRLIAATPQFRREQEAASQEAEPLRILVAGQTSVGKSSLVNALGREVRAAVDVLPATAAFTPYRLMREGMPAALIIDSPGLKPEKASALIEQAANADLVLWVSAAHRADREPDRAALAGLRAWFTAHPNRRRPPLLLVVSHVDRLRPFNEWQPPYDLSDTRSAKAGSIRAAVEAAAGELGFLGEDAVPVCLADPPGLYNVDALWARIGELVPEAERARLVRALRSAEGTWDWRAIWDQAMTGGRILVKAALEKR